MKSGKWVAYAARALVVRFGTWPRFVHHHIPVFPISSSYFSYSPQVCSHAHHLPSSALPLSPTRLQLLAPLCHHLLRSPRSSPVPSSCNVVPHPHGPRSPNRSPPLHRLHSQVQQTTPLSRSSSSSSLTSLQKKIEPVCPETPSLRQKLASTLLGVKGSSLPTRGKKEDKQENPVVRLKLLLVSMFHAQ
jgi:hypothetical protein